jgi:hypothetical protein
MPKTSRSRSKTPAARQKSSNKALARLAALAAGLFRPATEREAKEKPRGFSLSSEATAEDRYGRMGGFPLIVSQRLVEANHHAKHQSINAARDSPALP